MGPGNQDYTDAQIMRILPLLQPLINFALQRAEEQWKQQLKTNRKL